MKDQPEFERIEMVVKPDDDPGDDHRGRSGVGTDAPMGDRRVLTVATITAVVALLLGWFIGYSARSPEAAPAAATTTQATEATGTAQTTVAAALPGEPIPLPATTRPRRTTTTTTLAPRLVEAVDLDPRLSGVEVTLTGAEPDGARTVLLELDVGESRLSRTDLGGRFYSAEWMLAGHDWVLLAGGSGNGWLVHDGDPPEVTSQGEIWESRWHTGTGRFWRPDWEANWSTGPEQWIEHDVAGEPTGATLELPYGSWAEYVDPRGGLVVEVAGMHYTVDTEGATQIGAGDLLGLSADIAVFWNCDDQLRCGPKVVDRDSGLVREVGTDRSADGVVRIEGVWGWGEITMGTVSPDGGACAVMLFSDDSAALGLLDLRSGATVELHDGDWWGMPSLAWSPDGRFVFYLSNDGGPGTELWVYDRTVGASFPVFVEPMRWDILAARPADGGG